MAKSFHHLIMEPDRRLAAGHEIRVAAARPKERTPKAAPSPAEEERFREIEDLYLSGILNGMTRGRETRH